ncbi:MAG TPA: TIGR03936 family radical SAM-associated protein [Spirochaetales bacterium]|nr:TIGR03936 family radical SAM-associated protein [Spirochaetales bacterium]
MQYQIDDFLPELLSVEKPVRYFGNESGTIIKKTYSLRFVLCYPDIYEIGMCNNAIRILYSELNAISNIMCDRVFTPKIDFAELLNKKQIPLFGLDSHESIKNADIIGFSIGYELLATNVLFTLDLAQIPVNKNERTEEDPLIIAGGPGISNPEPFIDFFDGIWIGEAEPVFFDIIKIIAQKKQAGASKSELLEILKKSEHFYDGTNKHVIRNIYGDFGKIYHKINFPTPCIKPVQEHAVVEIMRGCINGCRFCQAGYIYRPARLKLPQNIIKEIDDKIAEGYTSISLSSLSSGDYPGILDLLQLLSEKYRDKHISFQLPSLKIESFSLDILQHISELKKSGLTFAVETANSEWQKQLNKIVDENKVYEILKQAKHYGFQTAKFYFMIGLPIDGTVYDEAEAIIQFLKRIASSVSIEIHVTISVFVPKPHTPFQDAPFCEPEEVLRAIYKIKDALKHIKRIKISYHDPYMALVEYSIAQGNRSTTEVITKAYQNKCVFDAWDDNFKKEIWMDLLKIVSPRNEKPWKNISILVSPIYIKHEQQKSKQHQCTPCCTTLCREPCGSCTSHARIDDSETIRLSIKEISQTVSDNKHFTQDVDNKENLKHAVLIRFSKVNTAALLPHHDIVRHLETALRRINIPIAYSQGFHPMPRIEITGPLPLGIESIDEYALIYLREQVSNIESLFAINDLLPKYLTIRDCKILESQEQNYISLASIVDNMVYRISCLHDEQTCFQGILNNLEIYCQKKSIYFEKAALYIDIFTNRTTEKIQTIIENVCMNNWRALPIKITRLQQFSSKHNNLSPLAIY